MTWNREEHYLGWVHRELDRLQALDQQGGMPTLEVEDRIALRAEWYDVVDRYLAAVAAYEAGNMLPELRPQLIDVSMRLDVLTPALERLGLRQPDPGVLARMKLAAAS
jgi:hypothetical protein